MAANERTPLVQTVPVADQPPQRYPHRTLRYVCTVFLSLIPLVVLGAVLLSFFLPQTSFDDDVPETLRSLGLSTAQIRPSRAEVDRLLGSADHVDFPELSRILTETPEPEKAREWSKYYTSGPHLAGKNLSQALWTRDRWESWGVKSDIVSYDIYVNYPVGHRLAMLEAGNVTYEASLEEDVLEEDPTSDLDNKIPTFHGYSASGNVTAGFVFCNYGTYRDFEDLREAWVPLEGKIALVKYGGVFRGLKVKRAQELGMVGVVMYSDPGDDGDITEANGYKTYPDGPARNPSSVQRGSTQFLSQLPGDPTTPGYPSKPGCPRTSGNESIPSIPSLPISYTEALPLLKALNGHGPHASHFDKRWQGGGLGYKGVKYNIGPSPANVTLNLVNEQEYVTTPMWNAIGIINGTFSDEVVVLGNHRDAWIAGGAADPNSGSAALNEVVRSFGAALSAGWKPQRTVVFASWDGEEYGLIGSTEWVEEYLPWLSHSTVAYLNVDVGTSGPNLHLASAPLLSRVATEVFKTVLSPNQTIANQTVYDLWDKKVHPMGSGSDFTAFQDFAGIPSLDMGFAGETAAGLGEGDIPSPVYHYHSNYDSFAWMDRFGDPGFKYHATIARIWALVAARLVEMPILPLNALDYAHKLKDYTDAVRELAAKQKGDVPNNLFDPLDRAIHRFTRIAKIFDDHAADLASQLESDAIPWWKWWEKVKLYVAIRRVNMRYKYLERAFLFSKGLDGRSWFKHVIFAPGRWTGYAGATMPGIVEAVEDGEWGRARRWVGIVTGSVAKGCGVLESGNHD